MRIQTPVEVIGNKVCTKDRDIERLTIVTTNEKAFGPTPWADDIGIAINSYEAMLEALKGAQNDINFHGGKLSGGTIDAIKKALTLAEGKE